LKLIHCCTRQGLPGAGQSAELPDLGRVRAGVVTVLGEQVQDL
jgi:hypothetical protein